MVQRQTMYKAGHDLFMTFIESSQTASATRKAHQCSLGGVSFVCVP